MANSKPCVFDLYKALVAAGIPLPENIRRIVIDCNVANGIAVYYETYASKEMLDVVVESLMQNKDDIETIKIE